MAFDKYSQNIVLSSGEFEKERKYWQEKLQGGVGFSAFPADPGALVQPAAVDFNGRESLEYPFAPEVCEKLNQMSKRSEYGLFVMLAAAAGFLLYRYSGNEDVVMGMPVFASKTNAQAMNHLVILRSAIHSDQTYKDLILEMRTAITEADEYSNFPFPVMLGFLNPEAAADSQRVGTVVLLEQIHDLSRLVEIQADLLFGFSVMEGKILLRLKYHPKLYSRKTVERLLGSFGHALERMTQNPNLRLGELDILPEPEKRKILLEFNQTRADYPKDKTIYQLFEEQAARIPDQTAVIFEDQTLTYSYSALNRKANQLARVLRGKGVGPDDIVAVMAERSPEMSIGLLAILKAGGAYLPISPEYPGERIQYLLEDSGAKLVLTTVDFKDKAGSGAGVFDLKDPSLYTGADGNLENVNAPTDLAYVIYTSGSTGKPKGAMIEHYSLVNRLNWMQKAYPIGPGDLILQKTPYTFDVSVWELFWWSMTGAGVCFLKPGGEKDPAAIVAAIEKNRITTMHFVPSMLSAFLGYLEHSLEAGKLRSLRRVFASGEALTPQQVNKFNQLLAPAGTRLHNLYGPTEATVDVSYFDCPAEGGVELVPIGKPIDNIRLFILDPRGNPQPIGVPGELYIAGDGLARGYLKRPELTAEKFVSVSLPGVAEGASLRMYRTGDLARWLPDGNIEYLGRIDFQVKIRGFRIELGEIEVKLLTHEKIKEAVAVALDDLEGNKYLCAYYVADEQLAINELRDFIAAEMPAYMVPSYFVRLERMPLTPNGKLDRKALPRPSVGITPGEEYEAPTNETEAKLEEMWRELLNVPQPGINGNFFNLGGDSIKAISLISKMNRIFGTKIGIKDIYNNQTIKKLAEYLETAGAQGVEDELGQGLAAIDKLKQETLADEKQAGKLPDLWEDFYPLSPIQQGMVFFSQLMPDEPIYHDQFAYLVKLDRFEIGVFNEALAILVKKHPILRTTFTVDSFSQPMQIVHSPDSGLVGPVVMEDFSKLDHERQEQGIRDYMMEDLQNKFKFANDVLWRLRVFRLDAGNYCIILSCQHAVLDGWSVASFMSELLANMDRIFQGQPPETGALKSSYKDYVAINLSRRDSESVREFWKELLQGYTRNKLPFNISNKKINNLKGGRILRREMDFSLLLRLEEMAKFYRCSLKDICLAAHVYLLGVVTTDSDIITGVVTHDRPVLEDSEKVLGCFLNTIPVRIRVENEIKKIDLLDQVKNNLRNAKAHELFLADIAGIIGDNSGLGNPIFDTLHNFTDFHVLKSVENSGLVRKSDRTLGIDPNEMTNTLFDLEISRTLDIFSMQLKYSPNYFTDADIQTAADLYVRILEEFASQGGEYLRSEELLSREQIRELVHDYNNTRVPYAHEKTMHQLFEEQAARTPDGVALVQGDRQMTYRELNEKSNRLARLLVEKGVRDQDHVALVAQRGFAMIAGMLAILKCGGAYVPVDPEYPAARKKYIADNSKVSAILVDERYEDLDHENIILMDEAQIDGYSAQPLNLKKGPRDLAYVIYTSGSTGVPKGVMIEHHSAVNLISWVNREFGVCEKDALLFITSMCFDLSVYDIFGTLAAGARVVIARREQVQNPEELKQLLTVHRITFWDSVPSTMNYLVNTLEESAVAGAPAYVQTDLRLVFMSGDWIPVALPMKLLTYFPNARPISLGGATEGTVWSIYYPIEKVDEFQTSIPYGRPLDNNYFYILDKDLRVVPKGVAGELYIGGVGVARGYMNDESKTNASFVKNRFITDPRYEREAMMYKTGDLGRMLPDNNIEFLGRMDYQVKIRGYRVELGEIETKLLKHPAVKDAVVVDKAGADGNKFLCAYLVWSEEQSVAQMREYLAKELPDYMIPAYFIGIDKVPLTANGKIDRKALPEPGTSINTGVEYVPPRDEIEAKLVEIWQEVVEVDKVGVNDNFFDLGGNSLSMIKVNALINQRLGKQLAIVLLFQYPTIRSLSQYLAQSENSEEQEAEALAKIDDSIQLMEENLSIFNQLSDEE